MQASLLKTQKDSRIYDLSYYHALKATQMATTDLPCFEAIVDAAYSFEQSNFVTSDKLPAFSAPLHMSVGGPARAAMYAHRKTRRSLLSAGPTRMYSAGDPVELSLLVIDQASKMHDKVERKLAAQTASKLAAMQAQPPRSPAPINLAAPIKKFFNRTLTRLARFVDHLAVA